MPVRQGLKALRGSLCCDDPKVSSAISYRSNHSRANSLLDIKLDLWVELGKTINVLRQKLGQRGSDGVDSNVSFDSASIPTQFGVELGHGLLELPGVKQQGLTCWGQLYPPSITQQ
ncbi:hypothetical protein D3C80_1452860 [compost metagenome]